MGDQNKILDVTYGGFSCRLEGFDDSVETLKAVVSYFQEISGDDTFTSGAPKTPDIETLTQLAQDHTDGTVEIESDGEHLSLRVKDNDAAAATGEDDATDAADYFGQDTHENDALADDTLEDDADENMFADLAASVQADMPTPEVEDTPSYDAPAATDETNDVTPADHAAQQASVADKLQRIRAVVGRGRPPEGQPQTQDDYSEDLSETATDNAPSVTNPLAQRLADLAKRNSELMDADALLENPAPAAADPLHLGDEDRAQSPAEAPEYDDTTDLEPTEDALENDAAPADELDQAPVDDIVTPDAMLLRDPVETPAETASPEIEMTQDAPIEDDEAPHAEIEAADDMPDAADADDIVADVAQEPVENEADTMSDETAPVVEAEAEIETEAEAEDTEALSELILTPEQSVQDETDEDQASDDTAQDTSAKDSASRPLLLTPAGAPVSNDDAEDDDFDLQEEVAELARELASRPGNELARHGLPRSVEDAMSRILMETNQHLDEPEGRRHRDAFAQLKAAVASTEAARQLGDAAKSRDIGAMFKDDFGALEAAENAKDATGPALKLVKDDDGEPISRPLDAASERLRQIAAAKESETSELDTENFAAFAQTQGATELADLLEAAAAYISFVDGETDFSRPQVMKVAQTASDDEITREDGLRSFGRLLRQSRLIKLNNGRFQVSDSTRFKPSSNRAARG